MARSADLEEPRAELWVQDVEVVRPDAALLPAEVQARDSRLARPVPRAPHPLELFGHDERHDPEAALAFGSLQIRPHVIELAVIPARAIRPFEPQHRDLVGPDEPARIGPERVTDPPQSAGDGIG